MVEFQACLHAVVIVELHKRKAPTVAAFALRRQSNMLWIDLVKVGLHLLSRCLVREVSCAKIKVTRQLLSPPREKQETECCEYGLPTKTMKRGFARADSSVSAVCSGFSAPASSPA